MKKSHIKLKGKLRRYLYWPLYLTILLVIMNIVMYTEDVRMGGMFTALWWSILWW